MKIVMNANEKIISPINDYSCINKKCSEFLYQPIDKIEAYGMRKENFNEIMKNSFAKRIKKMITQNYSEII
jgi:hypothetical protein